MFLCGLTGGGPLRANEITGAKKKTKTSEVGKY